MATVNKDFRVKSGLVVEGANATVNGDNIITATAAQTLSNKTVSDGFTFNDGSNNSAIYVEGNNLTIAAHNDLYFNTNNADINFQPDGNAKIWGAIIATQNYVDNAVPDTTDGLSEGSVNKYYSTTLAKSDAAALLTGATLTNITITGNGSGLTITAENGVADSTTDDLTEGTTNKYFTAQRALDATASAYDAAGAASTAETNAKSYADGLASNYDPAGSATTAENNAKSYADTVAGTAESNAKSYADSLASNYDAAGAAASALTSANGYTDTAVANLVDGAPALLNTLNELAAAINDDASFASTIATSIGEKVAKSGDTMTGALTLSGAPTNDLHAATKKYVDDAVSGTVGVLNSDAVAEGTTNLYFTNQRAINAIGTNPTFTTVDLSWVRREEAAYVAISSGQTGTAHSFTGYGTAKYLVRVYSAGHSQTSEVLVVRDGSGNVAITEYGIVYTSENPLAEITADNDGGTYRLRVTAGAANIEVLTAATLLQYND